MSSLRHRSYIYAASASVVACLLRHITTMAWLKNYDYDIKNVFSQAFDMLKMYIMQITNVISTVKRTVEKASCVRDESRRRSTRDKFEISKLKNSLTFINHHNISPRRCLNTIAVNEIRFWGRESIREG